MSLEPPCLLPSMLHSKLPRRLPESKGFSIFGLDFTAGGTRNLFFPTTGFSKNTGEIVSFVKFNGFTLNFQRIHDQPFLTPGGRLYLGTHSNQRLWYRIGNIPDTYGDTVLRTGRWYMPSLSWDNGVIQLYLNAQPDDTPQADVLAAIEANHYIGNTALLNLPLNGWVAEHLVYNRPLTSWERQYNMRNLDHPIRNGLVLCLMFLEGAGLTAYDLSGQGNHGNLLPIATPPLWFRTAKWEIRADLFA